MKILSSLLLLAIFLGISVAIPGSRQPRIRTSWVEDTLRKGYNDWQQFKHDHDKSYGRSEERSRFISYLVNKDFVDSHNEKFQRGEASFAVKTNHFADMSDKEYRTLNGFRGNHMTKSSKSHQFRAPHHAKIPDHVDWRENGFVTPVKNQGHCGSCWAFSTTGVLEGQYKRVTGKLISLSEQNLVDCSKGYGTEPATNQGCNGGLMDNAFQYIMDNGGIDLESAYPYKANDSDLCHFRKAEAAEGLQVYGYVDIPKGDEEALKVAVATQGPIAVAIDASHRSFRMYAGGVFYESECDGDSLSHAVLVVGYGTDPELGDYWLVKNSWGTEWGVEGYIRMARNEGNHCGIANMASYPLI
ncbi:hypothetical protein L596_017291 [Steinernema carpocapsae]|uniref:Cathepsin L-like n=1 Tax=Steinernema carpocapsae TaxID=34508 RepID=A0A4U5N175_STECR|nr:hypothetical protein L596_017291 [Steinernema carpocapsae]